LIFFGEEKLHVIVKVLQPRRHLVDRTVEFVDMVFFELLIDDRRNVGCEVFS